MVNSFKVTHLHQYSRDGKKFLVPTIECDPEELAKAGNYKSFADDVKFEREQAKKAQERKELETKLRNNAYATQKLEGEKKSLQEQLERL